MTLDGRIELILGIDSQSNFKITVINYNNNNKNNKHDYIEQIVSMNQWTHYCYQFKDALLVSRYRNGSLVQNYSSSQTIKLSPNTTMATMSVGGDGFTGGISSVYLYSKILTGEEIQDSYQKHEPLNNVLFGWWSFVL